MPTETQAAELLERSFERAPLPRRALWIALGLFCVALFFDGATSWAPVKGQRFSDGHSMFRILGYLPTWIVIGTALALEGRRRLDRGCLRRAGLWVFTQAAAGGVAAAVLKVIVRRRKPPQEGPYPGWIFEPLGDIPWSGWDLGFPSEHAAVAWGALIALSRLFPGATPVFLFLGVGVSFGRVQARGHHVSDVVFSLVLVLFLAPWIDRLFERKAARALATRTGGADPGPSIRADRRPSDSLQPDCNSPAR